jgi:hypothetical protein
VSLTPGQKSKLGVDIGRGRAGIEALGERRGKSREAYYGNRCRLKDLSRRAEWTGTER